MSGAFWVVFGVQKCKTGVVWLVAIINTINVCKLTSKYLFNLLKISQYFTTVQISNPSLTIHPIRSHKTATFFVMLPTLFMLLHRHEEKKFNFQHEYCKKFYYIQNLIKIKAFLHLFFAAVAISSIHFSCFPKSTKNYKNLVI